MLTEASDPWARLRALIRVYVHFATNNPAYFRIMFDSGFANRPENIGRARPTFRYLVDVIAEIGGSSDGAFEKAVAIWASMHGLSALMLSGQLGGVLKKPARAARLEQTVAELIERELGRARAAICIHRTAAKRSPPFRAVEPAILTSGYFDLERSIGMSDTTTRSMLRPQNTRLREVPPSPIQAASSLMKPANRFAMRWR
jgi:AcrR family transcriptional regulator